MAPIPVLAARSRLTRRFRFRLGVTLGARRSSSGSRVRPRPREAAFQKEVLAACRYLGRQPLSLYRDAVDLQLSKIASRKVGGWGRTEWRSGSSVLAPRKARRVWTPGQAAGLRLHESSPLLQSERRRLAPGVPGGLDTRSLHGYARGL